MGHLCQVEIGLEKSQVLVQQLVRRLDCLCCDGGSCFWRCGLVDFQGCMRGQRDQSLVGHVHQKTVGRQEVPAQQTAALRDFQLNLCLLSVKEVSRRQSVSLYHGSSCSKNCAGL